ncbi:unnamed protein product [Effrenium voratum]|uniref:Uncharacterized protein n=1 Tax=Effrenium voratum TaxID=2562239 RepID=A0AA36IEG9_9DINO|nr:unnamed protein product [Effrenium voratum]
MSCLRELWAETAEYLLQAQQALGPEDFTKARMQQFQRVSYAVKASNLSLKDATELMKAMKATAVFSETETLSLLEQCTASVASVAAPLHKRRVLQDYVHFPMYIPADLWSTLGKKEVSGSEKALQLADCLARLGLCSPSEPTSRSFTAVCLLASKKEPLLMSVQEKFDAFLTHKEILRSVCTAKYSETRNFHPCCPLILPALTLLFWTGPEALLVSWNMNTKKEIAVTKIKAEQKTSNEDLLHALVAHLRPQPLEIRDNKLRSLPAIMDRYHEHEDEPEPKKLRAAASMLSLTSSREQEDPISASSTSPKTTQSTDEKLLPFNREASSSSRNETPNANPILAAAAALKEEKSSAAPTPKVDVANAVDGRGEVKSQPKPKAKKKSAAKSVASPLRKAGEDLEEKKAAALDLEPPATEPSPSAAGGEPEEKMHAPLAKRRARNEQAMDAAVLKKIRAAIQYRKSQGDTDVAKLDSHWKSANPDEKRECLAKFLKDPKLRWSGEVTKQSVVSEKETDLSTKEWLTKKQIANEQSLSLEKPEEKELVDALLKTLEERDHENSEWARRGIKQYKYVRGSWPLSAITVTERSGVGSSSDQVDVSWTAASKKIEKEGASLVKQMSKAMAAGQKLRQLLPIPDRAEITDALTNAQAGLQSLECAVISIQHTEEYVATTSKLIHEGETSLQALDDVLAKVKAARALNQKKSKSKSRPAPKDSADDVIPETVPEELNDGAAGIGERAEASIG